MLHDSHGTKVRRMSDIDLKPGDIIVADPSLGFDPAFGQSVIILLAHSHATVGINVASNNISVNIFEGGPVKMPVPVALHKSSDSINSSRPVGQTGYSTTELDGYETSIDLLQKKPYPMVVAAGYAGWGPGQLEDEISKGMWKKSNLTVDQLLNLPAKDRWRTALMQAANNVLPPPDAAPANDAASKPAVTAKAFRPGM